MENNKEKRNIHNITKSQKEREKEGEREEKRYIRFLQMNEREGRAAGRSAYNRYTLYLFRADCVCRIVN